RRPLERPRPTRPGVQRAEASLLVERVDLDHDPVDLVVELDPLRLPLAAGGGDLLDRFEALCVRVCPEASVAEPLEHAELRLDLDAVAGAGPVDPGREGTVCRDPRVLLAE